MASGTLILAIFAALLLLLALRVPIAIALFAVSIVGIWLVRGETPMMQILSQEPFAFASSWSLSAVPLFIFMGMLAERTGLSSALFKACSMWFGRLPGGLAVATNFACAGFAAASGSSLSTAAAMGRIAVPEMLKYRYQPGLATAVVASAGTLGSLIPPSIAFILTFVY